MRQAFVPILLTALFGSSHAWVTNRTTNTNFTRVWLETGTVNVDDSTWVSATTFAGTFTNAIIMISVPPIPGNTANDGYPAAPRVKSIVRADGQVSFQTKIYQANDTYCNKTLFTPVKMSSKVAVSWMVIEKGAYLIQGGYYFTIFTGDLTRTSPNPIVAATDFFAINLPLSFPSSAGLVANIAVVATIQSWVNDRFLFVRIASIVNRGQIKAALCVADGALAANYIVSAAENVGFIAFFKDKKLVCAEGLSFETFLQSGVNSQKFSFKYSYTYTNSPGAFGNLNTYTSLTDSTNIRIFNVNGTNFNMITQEDKCYDAQTTHTTDETVALFVAGKTSTVGTTLCFARYNDATPTSTPTRQPTLLPTPIPSKIPTSMPTSAPTSSPTNVPIVAPTQLPTRTPSQSPTSVPTSIPTSLPTFTPTRSPTSVPTSGPSSSPTSVPTKSPTSTPTSAPTTPAPTKTPTSAPTSTCSGSTFTVKMTKS